MEPEIGFLMANMALAGVSGGGAKRVLDPCCGSGRLLLYAAALGSTEVIGVDSDPHVWDDVEWEDHERVRQTQRLFFVGDVQYPISVDALNTPDSFDAMVCDPPYNIGAPVYVNSKDLRPRNYHDKGEELQQDDTNKLPMDSSTDLVRSILSIAAKVLVKGGRIVFLLPVRGNDTVKSVEELLSLRGCSQVVSDDGNENCQLRLLKNSSRRHRFSPTFSRWLVCMEKI
jgi:tRNA G10  N-methylase Trm11